MLVLLSRGNPRFESATCMVSRGDVSRGIELLQTAVTALHEDGYEVCRPQLSVALAEGLAKTGERELACSAVGEEIAWVKAQGRVVDLADLLCMKGEILNSMSQQDASEGIARLLQALEIAQQRGLLDRKSVV